MNIGYKDSPLGKIPSDWVIEKLESLVVIESGVSPSQYEFHENGKNMFYKVNQLNDFEKKMGESPYRFESNLRNNIPANSIAFPKRGASIFTNKVRILSYPAMVDTNIMCLIPKKEINYEFLYYFILDFGLSKIADTSSIPQINNKHIYPIKIALPPLPEQQKIAEILSTVDAKIEVIDQQITETQAFKKGLMQRLLTKGIGHTEFKDSALGEIPKSWEVISLGDIANFSQGIQVGTEQHISELIDGYQRFIRIIDYTQPNKNEIRYVPTQGERYFANAKDIIMIRYGTPGVIGRGIEGIIANNMFKITFNHLVINDFAEHYFKYSETIKKIKDGSASSTMPAINFGFLKKIPFLVPTLLEQQKIAEILYSVDAKLEVLSEKKTHYQELKQGLMQQLLTGKIRVKTNNTVTA